MQKDPSYNPPSLFKKDIASYRSLAYVAGVERGGRGGSARGASRSFLARSRFALELPSSLPFIRLPRRLIDLMKEKYIAHWKHTV